MSHSQLQRRCPSVYFQAPACLTGYRLAFTRCSKKRGGGVADVERDSSGHVWGGLFTISAADAAVLDRSEGLDLSPPAYRRVAVQVALGNPEVADVEAYTYEVVDKDGPYLPAKEYLDALVQGARDCQLPVDYIADLTRIEVV